MGFSLREERERLEKLPNCKTVKEVEALRCAECSNNGHYGWCASPHILCKFKDKIEEITGINTH